MPRLFSILFVIALLIACPAAQAQKWLWAREAGCGANQGGTKGWLTKTDQNDNVYMAGYYSGDSVCFGSSVYYNPVNPHNNIHTILVKYDSAGNLLWSRASSNGQSRPISMATDALGNVLVFGFFTTQTINFGTLLLTNPAFDTLHPAFDTCFYVVKYNPSGNLVWARNGSSNIRPNGDFLHPGGIGTDAAGNVYIASTYTRPYIVIGPDTLYNQGSASGTDDMFVARYDSAGTLIWAKSFGGLKDDYLTDLAVGTDGKIYIAGYYTSGFVRFGSNTIYSSSQNAFLACLDNNGNPLWAKSSGNTATAKALATDNNNHIYLSGGFTSSVQFGSNTLQSPFGGFYLYRFNDSGTVLGAIGVYPTAGYAACCTSLGIVADNCNNIWISAIGDVLTSIQLNSATIIHPPAGSVDPMFFAGFSPSGSLVGSAYLPSGAGYNTGLANTGFSADAKGDVYLCGDFRAIDPFVLGADTLHNHNGEASTMFLAKYQPVATCDTSVNPVYPDVPVITIYPNPASYSCTLNYLGNIGAGAMVAIRDISGRELSIYPITGIKTELPLAGLGNGIYMCVIKIQGRASYTIKLVVLK